MRKLPPDKRKKITCISFSPKTLELIDSTKPGMMSRSAYLDIVITEVINKGITVGIIH